MLEISALGSRFKKVYYQALINRANYCHEFKIRVIVTGVSEYDMITLKTDA